MNNINSFSPASVSVPHFIPSITLLLYSSLPSTPLSPPHLLYSNQLHATHHSPLTTHYSKDPPPIPLSHQPLPRPTLPHPTLSARPSRLSVLTISISITITKTISIPITITLTNSKHKSQTQKNSNHIAPFPKNLQAAVENADVQSTVYSLPTP